MWVRIEMCKKWAKFRIKYGEERDPMKEIRWDVKDGFLEIWTFWKGLGTTEVLIDNLGFSAISTL